MHQDDALISESAARNAEQSGWTGHLRQVSDTGFVAEPQTGAGRRTFGGRLLAEALLSAGRTAGPGFLPHSISAQFLEGTREDGEIQYEVELLRDGRSFGYRQVRARQDGTTAAVMLVTLATDRPSPEHGATMPTVPGPEQSPTEAECRAQLEAKHPRLAHRLWSRPHPIEVRPADFAAWTSGTAHELSFWFRAEATVPDDSPLLRAALLAYASDRLVLSSTLLSRLDEVETEELSSATISHSLWLHRDYPPGSWILCHVQHRALAGARAFIRSEMFSIEGSHLASMGQEGLVAFRPATSPTPSSRTT